MVFTKMRVVEETLNSVVSGIGLLLSVAALSLLVFWASGTGNAWAVTSVSIFGSSLILVYLTSVLCHSLSATRAAQVMEIIDCSAVYVLIAATYTPFIFIALRTVIGWTLFGIVWCMAVIGILLTTIFLKKGSVILYLLMGWTVVIVIGPLLHRVPSIVIWWLFCGGVAYSIGIYFFLSKRHFRHILWHASVIAGSVCHFFAIAAILQK